MSEPEPIPPTRHVPVLAQEVLHWLDPRPGEVWVDATLGGGGHARLLAERVGPSGRLLALDQDAAAVERVRPSFAAMPWVSLHVANFESLPEVLAAAGLAAVDGVLADLGVSSDQLDDPARGLAFALDGPLDMRLSQTGTSAADLVNRLSERELAEIIFRYGEERYSRRIARRIVQARRDAPIRTTAELARLVRQCVPRSHGHSIDPATRTFQALRVAVNDELAVLEALLRALPVCVRPGGRVGIISFHSLEDRPVKHALRDATYWEVLTKKPITASSEEVERNPRSRSAKFRAARRRAE
jgi:16S rRNA (cytosine1402-N4)-methyltransferase